MRFKQHQIGKKRVRVVLHYLIQNCYVGIVGITSLARFGILHQNIEGLSTNVMKNTRVKRSAPLHMLRRMRSRIGSFQQSIRLLAIKMRLSRIQKCYLTLGKVLTLNEGWLSGMMHWLVKLSRQRSSYWKQSVIRKTSKNFQRHSISKVSL